MVLEWALKENQVLIRLTFWWYIKDKSDIKRIKLSIYKEKNSRINLNPIMIV